MVMCIWDACSTPLLQNAAEFHLWMDSQCLCSETSGTQEMRAWSWHLQCDISINSGLAQIHFRTQNRWDEHHGV